LKIDIPIVNNKHYIFGGKNLFLVGILKATDERAGSGSGTLPKKKYDIRRKPTKLWYLVLGT
jgi:hypothetical protein